MSDIACGIVTILYSARKFYQEGQVIKALEGLPGEHYVAVCDREAVDAAYRHVFLEDRSTVVFGERSGNALTLPKHFYPEFRSIIDIFSGRKGGRITFGEDLSHVASSLDKTHFVILDGPHDEVDNETLLTKIATLLPKHKVNRVYLECDFTDMGDASIPKTFIGSLREAAKYNVSTTFSALHGKKSVINDTFGRKYRVLYSRFDTGIYQLLREYIRSELKSDAAYVKEEHSETSFNMFSPTIVEQTLKNPNLYEMFQTPLWRSGHFQKTPTYAELAVATIKTGSDIFRALFPAITTDEGNEFITEWKRYERNQNFLRLAQYGMTQVAELMYKLESPEDVERALCRFERVLARTVLVELIESLLRKNFVESVAGFPFMTGGNLVDYDFHMDRVFNLPVVLDMLNKSASDCLDIGISSDLNAIRRLSKAILTGCTLSMLAGASDMLVPVSLDERYVHNGRVRLIKDVYLSNAFSTPITKELINAIASIARNEGKPVYRAPWREGESGDEVSV